MNTFLCLYFKLTPFQVNENQGDRIGSVWNWAWRKFTAWKFEGENHATKPSLWGEIMKNFGSSWQLNHNYFRNVNGQILFLRRFSIFYLPKNIAQLNVKFQLKAGSSLSGKTHPPFRYLLENNLRYHLF